MKAYTDLSGHYQLSTWDIKWATDAIKSVVSPRNQKPTDCQRNKRKDARRQRRKMRKHQGRK